MASASEVFVAERVGNSLVVDCGALILPVLLCYLRTGIVMLLAYRGEVCRDLARRGVAVYLG